MPKVSKPHLGSISLSNWYGQRIDRVKKWLTTCQFVFISGRLPVKRPFKKIRKIFIASKVSSWNFRGSLLSYFWAITLVPAVIAILDPFGTLVPRISATVNMIFEVLSIDLQREFPLLPIGYKPEHLELRRVDLYVFLERRTYPNVGEPLVSSHIISYNLYAKGEILSIL